MSQTQKPGIAVKANPKLWEEIKTKYTLMDSYGGKGWNARKAQAASKEYKERGGTYKGPKPTAKNNSLTKWTKEDWNYINPQGNTRYLPQTVRDNLTSTEKAVETRLKKDRKGQHIPYSKTVREKFSKLVN